MAPETGFGAKLSSLVANCNDINTACAIRRSITNACGLQLLGTERSDVTDVFANCQQVMVKIKCISQRCHAISLGIISARFLQLVHCFGVKQVPVTRIRMSASSFWFPALLLILLYCRCLWHDRICCCCCLHWLRFCTPPIEERRMFGTQRDTCSVPGSRAPQSQNQVVKSCWHMQDLSDVAPGASGPPDMSRKKWLFSASTFFKSAC